jgi:hypothetical protein
MRRIFGPERDEVTWNRRGTFAIVRSIIRATKSTWLKWMGYVACMGRGETQQQKTLENLKETEHLGDSAGGDDVV